MSGQSTSHSRVVGGVFALPSVECQGVVSQLHPGEFLRPGACTFVNARSAFHVLGRCLDPRVVWLPSYLCDAVCEGFRSAGCRLEYFPVDRSLCCTSSRWVEEVRPGDLVIRIHYFGFRNADPVFEAACLRGAILVDDAAQALLTSGLGENAAGIVYSPRKFVGLPDGACLVSQSAALSELPPRGMPPADWWSRSFSAVQRRRDFDLGLPETSWFARFQEAERAAPVGAYAMSAFSWQLLQTEFDFPAIAETRRRNYSYLAGQLGSFALFPGLLAGVVPLGFPVLMENRDMVRQVLFRRQIYPPVHWPVPSDVPTQCGESRWLSERIMTLPCDQRYGKNDMEAVVESFLSARPAPVVLERSYSISR